MLLNFEAAVAGGIPVIKTMREAHGRQHVSRVFGILNGTCNYILTRMEAEGLSFDACLKDAQRLGYAEADPDLRHRGPRHRAQAVHPDQPRLRHAASPPTTSIWKASPTSRQADIRAAGELGYRIKLLGVAQRTDSGIEQRVHPTMVPTASVIAQVHGVTNAVAIETDILGELLLSGPGAGGNATASAVVGDIADIAKSRPGFQHGPVFGRPGQASSSHTARRRCAPMRAAISSGSPCTTASACSQLSPSRMADNEISLESIVQHAAGPEADDQKTVILVTHETTEAAVRKAVDGITRDGHLTDKPQVIRIERAG